MPEAVRHDYQVSSEGAVRHWPIPYARLEDATPTPTNPAAVLSKTPGTQMCGTILTINATLSVAVIDFTCAMVHNHDVRNVLTYAGAVEATWGAIDVGDRVYYDRSATMPAGVYLSTSPLDNTGAANPEFGTVVPMDIDTDMALYPKGTALAGSTQECGVAQIGAGV